MLLGEHSKSTPQCSSRALVPSPGLPILPFGDSNLIMVQEEDGPWYPVRLTNSDGGEDGQPGGHNDEDNLQDSLLDDGAP